MKHTSKRLLSILLCLVLMLSLIPAAYAAEVNYTEAQAQKLAAEMRKLASEKEAAGKPMDGLFLRMYANTVEKNLMTQQRTRAPVMRLIQMVERRLCIMAATPPSSSSPRTRST